MHQILVVENHDEERERLCGSLQNHLGNRCVICQAENGRKAASLLERLRPQVAILSVELPDISGLELARRIRQTGLPCMLLFRSAYENFSDAREAISLRALEYLPKSCGEGELLRAVENAVCLLEQRPEDTDTRILSGQLPTVREEPVNMRLDHFRTFVEQYIRDHYRTELSTQDVARAMNYSNAYFCKLFKQCFQVTFSAYLNDYRIVHAKGLLQNTRLNVREIGLACGYTDANYFARIFKRITGMTPTEYRFL